jgi:hypothetical protein
MEKRIKIQLDEPAHRALKSRAALDGLPIWKTASKIIMEAVGKPRRKPYAKADN